MDGQPADINDRTTPPPLDIAATQNQRPSMNPHHSLNTISP